MDLGPGSPAPPALSPRERPRVEAPGDLSPSQAAALGAVLGALARGDRRLCITGPAGSGKTTLLRVLLPALRSEGWAIVALAPTGKAAARMTEVSGEPAKTIHAALYRRVVEGPEGTPFFSDPRAPCAGRTVIVVDEASMVDTALDRELTRQCPRDAAILYIGDRDQLPPIEGTWGAPFDTPTAVLTEIHRQAQDNPLLAIATRIREGGSLTRDSEGEAFTRHRDKDLLDVVAAYAEARERGEEILVLCWTNKIRRAFCLHARRRLGRTQPLVRGDRLVALLNRPGLGIMNGHLLVVDRAAPWTGMAEDEAEIPAPFERESWTVSTRDGVRARVAPALFGVSTGAFKAQLRDCQATRPGAWLHVDYGEALTTWKAQGSQAPTVFLILGSAARFRARENPALARQFLYTAITRAEDRLVTWDL